MSFFFWDMHILIKDPHLIFILYGFCKYSIWNEKKPTIADGFPHIHAIIPINRCDLMTPDYFAFNFRYINCILSSDLSAMWLKY